jgi:hypothetical protein
MRNEGLAVRICADSSVIPGPKSGTSGARIGKVRR